MSVWGARAALRCAKIGLAPWRTHRKWGRVLGLGGRDETFRRHNREVLCRLRRRLVEEFDEAAGKV